MSAIIYYFTGTGNSLQVAKDLSAGLNGAMLKNIAAKTVQSNLTDEAADIVGFVFPVYAWGVPAIVAEFVSKIRVGGKPYVFAVATCNASPGKTLTDFRKILSVNGLSLSAGFALKQPNNYIIWSGPGSDEEQKKLIAQGKARIKQIIDIVNRKEEHAPETSGPATNFFGGCMHKLFSRNSWRQAKNFYATKQCNQCRICLRICPVSNIQIAEQGVSWGDKCLQCLACLQWCPQEAIQYKHQTLKRKRYHHPNIELTEMLLRK